MTTTYATGLAIRLAAALYDENEEAAHKHLSALGDIDPDIRKIAINGNVPDEDETLLHIAAGAAHGTAALALIEWGAEIDAKSEAGDTPLARALWANRWHDTEQIVLALIAPGADVTGYDRYSITPLHHAAAHCSPKVIKSIIAKGVDVNALDNDDYGISTLHKAAEDGNADAIPILLKAGADLDLATADGETSLLLAVMFGHEKAAKALISAGCNTGTGDAKGRTPLHFAARNGDDGIVEDLVSAGANLDAVDDLNQTPAQILAAFGEADPLDEAAKLAIFITIILQNSSGGEDYVESSFFAVLHEQQNWLVPRFGRFVAALEGCAAGQTSRGFMSRALAKICQFQLEYLTTAAASHRNPNDGFTVKNLDDDTVYDLSEDARVAFDRFFTGSMYVDTEITVGDILGLELKARQVRDDC